MDVAPQSRVESAPGLETIMIFKQLARAKICRLGRMSKQNYSPGCDLPRKLLMANRMAEISVVDAGDPKKFNWSDLQEHKIRLTRRIRNLTLGQKRR